MATQAGATSAGQRVAGSLGRGVLAQADNGLRDALAQRLARRSTAQTVGRAAPQAITLDSALSQAIKLQNAPRAGSQTVKKVLQKDNGLPQQAAQIGNIDEAVNVGLRKPSIVGSALGKASDKMLNKQSSLTAAQMRQGRLSTKTIGKVYDRTNIKNLDQQAELAAELTGGANSFMDEATNYALSSGGRGTRVDTQSLLPSINVAINKIPANALDDAARARLSKQMTDALTSTTSPIKTANSLRADAARMTGKFTSTTADTETARLYNQVADQIESKVYAAMPESQVNAMYANTVGEFRQRAADMATSNRKMAKAYTKLADELEAMPNKTIKNYRSFKKDFVDISKISKMTDEAGGGRSLNNMAGNGLFGRAIGGTADALLESPLAAATTAAGVVTRKAANAFNSGTAQKALKGAGLVGGGLLALSQLGQDNSAGRAMTTAPTTLEKTLNSANVSQTSQQPTANDIALQVYNAYGMNGDAGLGVATLGGYTLQQLEDGYTKAMTAGDTQAAKQLADMIDQLYTKQEFVDNMVNTSIEQQGALSSGGQYADLTSSQQNQIIGYQNAASSIDELENLFNQAGGGQGFLMGNIANIASQFGLNNGVQLYNAQRQALINTIKAAIGKTDAANTEPEVQRLLLMIPETSDNQAVAQGKLDSLRQTMNSMLNNALAVYRG
jgi:hypothetical protein